MSVRHAGVVTADRQLRLWLTALHALSPVKSFEKVSTRGNTPRLSGPDEEHPGAGDPPFADTAVVGQFERVRQAGALLVVGLAIGAVLRAI
jgi:hypothetical protein